MRLLFIHGWGFAADFWDPLAALLPEFGQVRRDRGYFGKPSEPLIEGPVVAVAHSFGAMWALRDPPAACRGLVAINGFDRFAAQGELPGVPARVIDRMVARFGDEPVAVLAEFRRRCGSEAPFAAPNPELLREDLEALGNLDCSAISAQAPYPILSLQGAADTILPPALRAAAFGSAPRFERATHPSGGHLLPHTDSAYCARAIRAFVEQQA